MNEPDTVLLNRLEKLDLETRKDCGESGKHDDSALKANLAKSPFQPYRRRSKSLSSINFNPLCNCGSKMKQIKHTTSFKQRNKRKIICREPVLKFIRCDTCNRLHKISTINSNIHISKRPEKLFGEAVSNKDCDFRTVIASYKNLNISVHNDNKSETGQRSLLKSFQKMRTAPNTSQSCSSSNSRPSLNQRINRNQRVGNEANGLHLNSTCSHQARMNVAPPCDVTIAELASYFETLVHIPKKMSSMAEMMYI